TQYTGTPSTSVARSSPAISAILGSVAELRQGFVGEAVDGPLVLGPGAQGLVEVDGGGVPVQNRPLEAFVVVAHAFLGQGNEEGLAEAGATRLGADEEVLEVDAVDTAPSGKAEEPDRAADHRALVLGHMAEDSRLVPEEGGLQLVSGQVTLLRGAL